MPLSNRNIKSALIVMAISVGSIIITMMIVSWIEASNPQMVADHEEKLVLLLMATIAGSIGFLVKKINE